MGSMDGINDFLSSATSARSLSQHSILNRSNLLSSLTKKEAHSPSSSTFRKPSKFTDSTYEVTFPNLPFLSLNTESDVIASDMISLHTHISNFKASEERDFNCQFVTANEDFIAYTVGKRKVRILGQSEGEKGMVDNFKDSQGSIVSIGLKERLLAILNDRGELLIGSVFTESKDSLGFDVIVSLTFPDLAPSRSLTWASGKLPILAVYGHGFSVFLVWLQPNPIGIELPHSLGKNIESVTFYRDGKFIAVSDIDTVECFEIDHDNKTFTKVAQLSFGQEIHCARINLFEDLDEMEHRRDFVIAAVTTNPSVFIACPVTVGQKLSWITSSVHLISENIMKTSICYDKLMKVFIIDERNGTFKLLGFRSDSPGFALIQGAWKEPLPVYSLCICPSLRCIQREVHIPLYVFQSEWVSLYGFKLPTGKNDAGTQEVLVESEIIDEKNSINSTCPLVQVPLNSSTQSEELKLMIKSIMMEHILPSVETTLQEVFKQVKDHLKTIEQSRNLHFETKLEQLTNAVVELKNSIENIPTPEQLMAAVSKCDSLPSITEELSTDDLAKKELTELLAEKSAPVVLLKGLAFGNLTILNWLLPQLDPESAIEGLHSTALLSLAQQLGSDLETDAELKIDWLTELATSYRPNDLSPENQKVSSEIFSDLFNNLRIIFAKAPPHIGKKIKLIMKLVRGLVV